MKTIEEIAQDVMLNWWPQGGPEAFHKNKQAVVSALTSALEQERNRVCEWELVERGGRGCDYIRALNHGKDTESCTYPYYSHCPSCGGRIQIKGAKQ